MSGVPSIDLNCDLGEGFGRWTLGDDDALLATVTSANIACGFHAGDPLTMLHALEEAARRGVAVGAHVGYRDLAGFGRRELDASGAELRGDVLYQLAALDGLARTVGTRVSYVKPHGALYNRIGWDAAQAAAVVDAVRTFDPSLVLLGLPDSAALRLAVDAGLATRREAFADRGYREDGTLQPRAEPGAVIADADVAAARAVRMVVDGHVRSSDGDVLTIDIDSICIHSDTAGAVHLARAVRAALESAGVALAPFAP